MSDIDERLELEALDPGRGDPGFWIRFHSRVLAQAQGELERRRMAQESGIADTVFAWRGILVPLTLMAAALAGILLVDWGSPVEDRSPAVALEEFLTEDLNLFSASGIFSQEGGVSEAVFAVAEEGF